MTLKQVDLDVVRLTHSRLVFEDRITLKLGNDTERLRMHFNLIGGYHCSYPQIGRSFQIEGQQHNLMYSNGIDLQVENHDLYIETMGMQFPLAFIERIGVPEGSELHEFLAASRSGSNGIFSMDWPLMTPKMLSVIDEILECQYNNTLKGLFYFSKALELFVLQVDALASVTERVPQFIRSKRDREMLIEAKRYAEQNINNPPDLRQTARYVGLNEYKLKKGFKEMFGTTLFDHVTAKRLGMAKQMLLDTDLTLAAIATKLGYSSPQYFNAAFKKMYGESPGAFRRSS